MVRLFNCYVPRKTLILFFLETALIAAALPIAAALGFRADLSGLRDALNDPLFVIQCFVSTAIYQTCFFLTEMYEFRLFRGKVEEAARVGQAVGYGAICLAVMYFAFPALMSGRGVFLYSAVLVLFFILLSRMSWWGLLSGSRTGARGRTLLIGAGPLAMTVLRELASRTDADIRVEGLLADPPDAGRELSLLYGCPVLGTTADITDIVHSHQISQIIVASDCTRECLAAIATLRISGVSVYDALSLLAEVTGRVWVDFAKPGWFIFSEGFHRSRLTAAIKRAIDLALASAGLIVCSPVMAAVAAMIRIDSEGPCLYRQTRVGLCGRPFQLFKFRSMRVDAEASGLAQWASDKDPRITCVGRYLRKFRLDELPQFLNIIRGEMSFVGPRPERPVFVEQLRSVIPYYDERHTVRPGLTGWAQVRFTYTSSIEDSRRKLEYDLYYLKQMSLAFDIAIVLYTVRVVLFGWEWGNDTVRRALENEKTGNLQRAVGSVGSTNWN
jgi:sugar transferase (PEP-CTERM system associated)